MISDFQGGFQQFFLFKNLDMLLELHSRDKWGLNNYDTIEIKSKGFYASSVTIHTFRI